MTITMHPYRREVMIKTGLSAFAITAYIERICKINGWEFSRKNIDRAKAVLDAMSVIEYQQKLFLPNDFDYIYNELKKSIKLN